MDILDDMGVSKLSAKVFSKVNYSFKVYAQKGGRQLTDETSINKFFHLTNNVGDSF